MQCFGKIAVMFTGGMQQAENICWFLASLLLVCDKHAANICIL